MLNHYLILLLNILKIPGVLSLAINLTFITIIGFIIYIFHKIFKNFPYSFLDILLSQVLIIVPYFITYYIGIGENRNLLIIGVHLLLINIVTLPILWYLKTYLWSEEEKGEVNLLTWKSPLLYYDINITLIYAYTLFVYILLLRLCSLKANIDLSFIFCMEAISVIKLILCYIPVILYIIVYILVRIRNIKEHLWSRTYNLLHSILLYLLQKKAFVSLFLKIYKTIYVVVCFCFRKDIKQGKTQKILTSITNFFYEKPSMGFFFLLLTGFLEVIITKHLHYFFSILWCHFILFTSCSLNFQLYLIPPVSTICFSDYLYKNWKNPYFPAQFWHFVDLLENESEAYWWFNIYTEEEILLFDSQRKKFKGVDIGKHFFRSPYSARLSKKLLHNPRISWLAHAAYEYRRSELGIRFMSYRITS